MAADHGNADRVRAWALIALDAECATLAETRKGGRNDQLNRSAFAIGQIVGGGHLAESEANERLWTVAKAVGLTNTEIAATLLSGMKAGMAEPRHPPEGNGEWRAGDSTTRNLPHSHSRYTEDGADALKDDHASIGKEPEPPPEPLETFSLAEFADKEVPSRKFIDERHLVPCHNVTLLMGDGGTGKSLLALQLIIAVATGGTWLGIEVRPGAALYVSAEEDKDENHIRAADVCAAQKLDFAALGDARIVSLAGEDATLAIEERKGRLVTTRLYECLALTLEMYRPIILVLDNLADVFGGNEISRVQAQQFIGKLRKLAIKYDCAILLLGHPSLSGLSSGSGTSGSTAWSNSVRSRLYLRRETVANDSEADELVRVLETMKANYGPKGNPINLRWECGVFVCIDTPECAGSDIGRAGKAERVFMKLLRTSQQRGIDVSANRAATPAISQTVEIISKQPSEATPPLLRNGPRRFWRRRVTPDQAHRRVESRCFSRYRPPYGEPMKRILPAALVAATLVFFPLAANAATVALIDGDTIRIGGETIRLEDIDAPETFRPRCERELILGLAAKARLRQLLDGGPISVKRHGTDRYRRTLATVYAGGVDVGEAMIASGHAVPWKPGRGAWETRFRHWCGGK